MASLNCAGPLDGVRVIDLSRLLPGPYATLCLQGLGAEVVKIEEPKVGDYLRHTPPFLTRDGQQVGAWFAAINRGKRSVGLNLRDPADHAALLALLADADVLVESFRPGVMQRLDLDPLALCSRFPRLIVASLTGWGQTGPMARLPGHDLGFCALAGVYGFGEPTMPRVQWADVAGGGLNAALRITAALTGRERQRDVYAAPEARWLDIAMLDGMVGLMQTQYASAAAHAGPDELLTGSIPNYNLYRCADGWLAVGALEPQFAAVLTQVTGEVTREGIARVLLGGTRVEWGERLADACVVPVLRPEEVSSHPQVVARGLFTEGLAHPPTGPVYGAAPALGEHNATELARVGYRPPESSPPGYSAS